MDNKTRPACILSTRDPVQNKRFTQAETEGTEKIFHANGGKRKASAAALVSDKVDFKTKTVTGNKKTHYIL